MSSFAVVVDEAAVKDNLALLIGEIAEGHCERCKCPAGRISRLIALLHDISGDLFGFVLHGLTDVREEEPVPE